MCKWICWRHHGEGTEISAAASTYVPMGLKHAPGGTFDVPYGHTSRAMASFALAYNASVNGERQKRISAALGSANEAASVATDRFIRGLGMARSLGEGGADGKGSAGARRGDDARHLDAHQSAPRRQRRTGRRVPEDGALMAVRKAMKARRSTPWPSAST